MAGPDHDQPPVTLYGHWTCPFVNRVAWALAERGIDHDLVEVPPSAVRPKDFVLPPEFVDHSPRLEVPMVRVGDEFLADSIPILVWLEAAVPGAPPLVPGDAGPAVLMRARMRWIDAETFPPMFGISYGTDPGRIAGASEALAAALHEMALWLGADGWLAGPAPSLADAVFVPVLVRLDVLRALGFAHPIPAAVEAYADRLREGSGWPAVAWSQDQTDEMVGRFEARRRKIARSSTQA